MSNSWKRFLALTLALVLSFGLAIPASAAGMKVSAKKGNVSWAEVKDPKPALTAETATPEKEEEKAPYADDEIVRVTIFFDGDPVLARYSAENIAESKDAISYRTSLKKTQNSVVTRISKQALGGEILDVEHLTMIMNAVSAEVPYGKIEAIKAVRGVADVVVEAQLQPEVFSVNETDSKMSTSPSMIGSSDAWAAGYTGAGSKIAIIDTGLDIEHDSFDPDAFDYAINSIAGFDRSTLLTYEKLLDICRTNELHAESFPKAIAKRFYRNSKVPFACNYVDHSVCETAYDEASQNNAAVGHTQDKKGEHGSHVAGIAAANRYINNGDGTFSPALSTVYTQGVAPDAQIFVMKVFGANGGAFESDYILAIEDAIILGADAINMSLGSTGGLAFSSDRYRAAVALLQASNVTLSVSMGNYDQWTDLTDLESQYATDSGSTFSGGSPGSYGSSFTVASVDNVGFTGSYFTVDNNSTMVFYSESFYLNNPIRTIAGTHDFVYVDGIGVADNNYNGNDFAALNLTGKIAVCNRGSSSFYVKANAAVAAGAIGVIIVNNVPGSLGLDLTGYNHTAPVVAIQQSEGDLFRGHRTGTAASGAAIYTGSMTIASEVIVDSGVPGARYTMSDFSSWGATGDLALKPEITAPGGNIYSVHGTHMNTEDGYNNIIGGVHEYENMSGTSMAAPQIAGMTALLAEYIRENNLEARTGKSERFLVQSLLSSTAEALKDDGGDYYSVLKQGAGLANVGNAIKARSYVEMDPSATVSAADGKVKAELGDDPARTGSYSVTFTLNNFSNLSTRYVLYGDFFTQDHFTGDDGLEYLDTATTEIPATVRFSVDGHPLSTVETSPAATRDLNGDGEFTQDDVQILLDYTVMTAAAFDAQYPNVTYAAFNTFLADVDGDGSVTSYDAKLLLDRYNASSRTAYSLRLRAGESVQVTADIQISMPAELDDNGAYVEGFLYAREIAVIGGFIPVSLVQHSIPVLGYYGSWGEPTMFDRTTALDALYNPKAPYLADGAGNGGFSASGASGGSRTLKGNPYVADETYLPERNAIRGDETFSSPSLRLIRNAAAARGTLLSGSTVLAERVSGPAQYLVYNEEIGWLNKVYQPALPFYLFTPLNEGSVITARVTAVPEYYVAANGSVDWAAVEAIPNSGMTLSYTATIDNTAPTVLGSSAMYDGTTLTVPVSDNRYVAAVALVDPSTNAVIARQGSDPAAALGGTSVYTFALDANEYPVVEVQAYDYACNLSACTINPTGGPVAAQRSELISERRSVEDVTPTAAPVLETIDEAAPIAPVTPVNPIGLNSVTPNIPGSRIPGTMFVKVTADERTGNGRYTMTYDPAKLRYVSTRFIGSDVISAISNDAATGTLTIAFAASEPYARGATILNVEFQKIGLANTSVTAVTNEINSNTGMSNSTTMQFKSVSAVSSVSIGVDNTYRLSPTVNAFPGTYTLRYTTNKSSVATVSSSGVITARKAGTALISVIATPTGGGAAGRCNVVVTVYDTATVGGGTTPLLPSVPTLP